MNIKTSKVLNTNISKSNLNLIVKISFQRKILRGNYNIEHEAFSGISRQAKDMVSPFQFWSSRLSRGGLLVVNVLIFRYVLFWSSIQPVVFLPASVLTICQYLIPWLMDYHDTCLDHMSAISQLLWKVATCSFGHMTKVHMKISLDIFVEFKDRPYPGYPKEILVFWWPHYDRNNVICHYSTINDGKVDYAEWSCWLYIRWIQRWTRFRQFKANPNSGDSCLWMMDSRHSGNTPPPKTPLQIHSRPLLTQDNYSDWASTSDGGNFYKLIEWKCLDGDLSLKLIVWHDDELLWMKIIMKITDIVIN